jgi:aspartate ammonia-lyase
LIGDEDVPMIAAYYGIQTQRAMANFDITGVAISHFPQLIIALAQVKKAVALATHELGHLEVTKKNAIVTACDAILAGQWHDQFPVDLIQGGEGDIDQHERQ